MTASASADALALDPAVSDIKTQADFLQTTYDDLKNGINDQKNRINANSQTIMKSMSDTPNQTNYLTHANLNEDDPSKTKIPNIDMSWSSGSCMLDALCSMLCEKLILMAYSTNLNEILNEMPGTLQRQMQIQTAPELPCGAEMQCECTLTIVQWITPQWCR